METGILTEGAPFELINGFIACQDRPAAGVHLPKGWVPKKGIEHTAYEAPAKDRTSADDLAPNVIFAKDDTPGIKPTDLAAVAKLKRKQLAKLYADAGYKETNNETRFMGGKDGHRPVMGRRGPRGFL
jgi:hypothetical protein